MGALANTLIQHGYNPTDAASAENGPRAAELAKEYGVSLGGNSGSYSANTGNSSVDSIINNSISSLSGLFPKNQTPYAQANPFSFDEALATQASTAEYSPYYNDLLTQYTQQVETNKSRSNEDLTNTLAQLAAGKEYYQGTQRTLLDRSIDQTNKGYAGNGLFFSGAKEKDIQNLKTDYNSNLQGYNLGQNNQIQGAQTQNQRTQQDQTTGLDQYTKNINEQKKFAIAGGVQQRQSEALNQYLAGEQQYYSQGLYGGGKG